MRIHRIALRDFKGVDECDVAFATDGITIVQGPNEIGKTSLTDAFDMLVGDPDSSTRARVKAAQPVGRDVGPWVQAVIESGDYRFTYTKQWLKGSVTELAITHPTSEQLSGRAAHDRVTQILGDTMDMALFGALRHQQGQTLDQAVLEHSASLATALDVAAGGAAAAAETGGALIDAITVERRIWSTPTGEANRARKDLRDAASTAALALQHAQEELSGVDARVDDHQRLSADIVRNQDQEPAMVAAVVARDGELQECIQAESALHDLELSAERARGPARATAAAADARRALLADVDAAATEVTGMTDEGRRAGDQLQQALAQRSECAERLARTIDACAQAAAAFDVAAADAQHLRDVFDMTSLTDRRERVATADAVVHEAEQFLAGCTVDADLLDAIDRAVVHEAGARGRLGSAGAQLYVTAESPVQLDAGGESWHLSAGESAQVPLQAGDALRIPHIARIAVQAADDDDAASQAVAAADALAQLLQRAGVPDGGDAADARQIDRQRREEEGRVAAARDSRSVALNDLTPDEMNDKIARANARVVKYLATRGTQPPVPSTTDEAGAARTTAENSRDEAVRHEDAARAAHAAADSAVRGLEGEARERTGRLQAVSAQLDAARSELAVARSEGTDDSLTAAAATAAEAADTASAALHQARAALEKADGESVRIRLGNARDAVDRLLRDRNEMVLQAAGLAGEIAHAGDGGLADVEARAREASEHADAARDHAERRAAAADLLAATMAQYRDAAQRAYVAPFRDAVERYGRLVFGADVQVDVDHATLQVVSRTKDGVTVPVGALSGGAREQMAVIGRLAAASLVAPGDAGGAPVIIDDALG